MYQAETAGGASSGEAWSCKWTSHLTKCEKDEISCLDLKSFQKLSSIVESGYKAMAAKSYAMSFIGNDTKYTTPNTK